MRYAVLTIEWEPWVGRRKFICKCMNKLYSIKKQQPEGKYLKQDNKGNIYCELCWEKVGKVL